MRPRLISFLATLFLTACASVPSGTERRATAEALASQSGLQVLSLPSGQFDLMAYVPAHPRPDTRLAIYIEGDGLAWITGSQPSRDPTPRDPVALRMALAQPAGNAAYLARPCQYVDAENTGCAQRYWTNARFAEEVVAATDRAIEQLKARFAAKQLTLVGYSGGGAVAALVAARRRDVDRLITVAGNLDHRTWTEHHRVMPLDQSLNPSNFTHRLEGTQQWHFVGGKDRVIPPELVQGFASEFPASKRPRVLIEPDFDHRCCWAEQWRRLYGQLSLPGL
jgi:dienelactone hydrolase